MFRTEAWPFMLTLSIIVSQATSNQQPMITTSHKPMVWQNGNNMEKDRFKTAAQWNVWWRHLPVEEQAKCVCDTGLAFDTGIRLPPICASNGLTYWNFHCMKCDDPKLIAMDTMPCLPGQPILGPERELTPYKHTLEGMYD